jgi:ribonuclease P protein component
LDTVSYKFYKKLRILKRKDYLEIQGSGKKFTSQFLIFIYKINSLNHIRIGLTITKKHGNSVFRNRIKRLLREAFRLSLPLIYDLPFDVVIIPKKGVKILSVFKFKEDFEIFYNQVNGQ